MITTRRSESQSGVFSSNVSVLEREPKTYKEESVNVSNDLDMELERARRHENLNRLLNYDRAGEDVKEEICSDVIVEDVVCATETIQSDDMRPTSTTMQFGDDSDVNEMFNELATNEGAKTKYKLNSKGKLLIVLYSLAVAVIMALIVLNTGIISSLKTTNAELSTTLAERQGQYLELQSAVDARGEDAYIIDKATNELNMVLGN